MQKLSHCTIQWLVVPLGGVAIGYSNAVVGVLCSRKARAAYMR